MRDRGVPTPQVLRYQDCETWLGRRPSTEVDRAAFLKRYLAAFGAGTEHDLTYFSGVGNWREVIDSCESALTWLEGPQGERLMDLKGLETLQSAQDVCRLVPRYDNIIYAYKDRSRFGWDGRPLARSDKGGLVLVSGRLAGEWQVRSARERLDVQIRAWQVPTRLRDTVIEGGRRSLATWLDSST